MLDLDSHPSLFTMLRMLGEFSEKFGMFFSVWYPIAFNTLQSKTAVGIVSIESH